jgi:hypothetical protein
LKLGSSDGVILSAKACAGIAQSNNIPNILCQDFRIRGIPKNLAFILDSLNLQIERRTSSASSFRFSPAWRLIQRIL